MPSKGYFDRRLGGGPEGRRVRRVSRAQGDPAAFSVVVDGHQVQSQLGGRIRGDEADLWLRDNDPTYTSRDRDLRRGVKRLPPELRKPA